MRRINIKSGALKLLGLVIFSTVFSSFSGKMGGDSFKIFIDKKVVVQDYVSHSSSIKSFQIDASKSNSQVDVYYSHCGKTGTSRKLIIKDAENNVLKQWNYPDADATSVSCKVKDLLSLGKVNDAGKLNLYYASKEMPKGRLLAAVLVNADNKVTP